MSRVALLRAWAVWGFGTGPNVTFRVLLTSLEDEAARELRSGPF